MLKYFREGLRLSILAELQNEDLKLKSFVQIVKKAVVIEIKVDLRPRATTWDMDQQYFWGFRLANIIAAKVNSQDNSQGQSIKDP